MATVQLSPMAKTAYFQPPFRAAKFRHVGLVLLMALFLAYTLVPTFASMRPSNLAAQTSPTVTLPSLLSALQSPGLPPQDPPPQCSIFVMDPSRDLGLPGCDWSRPSVWPFPLLNLSAEGIPGLRPEEAQHATSHWVSQAVECTGAAAPDMASADLVFVNLHCYGRWHMGRWFYGRLSDEAKGPEGLAAHAADPDPDALMLRAMRELQGGERWRRSRGQDFVISPFFPGFNDSMLQVLAPCADARPFMLAAEHRQFCPGNQRAARTGRGMLIPHVAVSDVNLSDDGLSTRDTFIFSHGACANTADPNVRWSSGKLMRTRLIAALAASNASDVDSRCACAICEGSLSHAETMARMRRSVFCPVLPGDTQSSRRLAEVVLSGCIPVFVGPPFHTLSMPMDVDYRALGVFLHVNDTSGWILDKGPGASRSNGKGLLGRWWTDIVLDHDDYLSVQSVRDVEPALRALGEDVVASKQRALREHRDLLYYGTPPGQQCSRLGRRIVDRLCEYSNSRKGAAAQQTAQE